VGNQAASTATDTTTSHTAAKQLGSSNLWYLNDELCQLFAEHRINSGSSLDGPEEINRRPARPRVLSRTMRGIRRAQAWGLDVSCIATFTQANLSRWHEVLIWVRLPWNDAKCSDIRWIVVFLRDKGTFQGIYELVIDIRAEGGPPSGSIRDLLSRVHSPTPMRQYHALKARLHSAEKPR